jgi:hypothetical protein
MSTPGPWISNYLHPAKWEQAFPPLSVHDMFFRSAERMGQAPLADFMGRKFSYAEMGAMVRRFAKGLQAHGVGKGDHVGLFLPNVPHYVAAYYGAMAAGATVVNFSPLYTVDELTHQVADSGTSILVTVSAAALLPTAIKVLEKSDLKQLIVGSVAEALPRVKGWAYRLFKKAEIASIPDDARILHFGGFIANDGDYAPQPCNPETTVAQLQYTGGTTGTPLRGSRGLSGILTSLCSPRSSSYRSIDRLFEADASRITTGRRNTIWLVRFLVRDSLRTTAPRYGMSPRIGTWDLSTVKVSSMSPPSTMISPSSTTTVDSIERLLVVGPALDVPGAVPEARLDDSWNSVIRTVPFSPICGRMRNVMPTSLRSMVWNGLTVELPPPVFVYWPVMKGTLLPTMIFASSLSSVTRFGVDTMLVSARNCNARAIADRP